MAPSIATPVRGMRATVGDTGRPEATVRMYAPARPPQSIAMRAPMPHALPPPEQNKSHWGSFGTTGGRPWLALRDEPVADGRVPPASAASTREPVAVPRHGVVRELLYVTPEELHGVVLGALPFGGVVAFVHEEEQVVITTGNEVIYLVALDPVGAKVHDLAAADVNTVVAKNMVRAPADCDVGAAW